MYFRPVLLIYLLTDYLIHAVTVETIATFEDYVELFPQYAYCSAKSLEQSSEQQVAVIEDCAKKKVLFTQSLKDIKEHNAKGLTWKMGIPIYLLLIIHHQC